MQSWRVLYEGATRAKAWLGRRCIFHSFMSVEADTVAKRAHIRVAIPVPRVRIGITVAIPVSVAWIHERLVSVSEAAVTVVRTIEAAAPAAIPVTAESPIAAESAVSAPAHTLNRCLIGI